MTDKAQLDRSQLLVSLAVLKVNWDERGRTYVDNFIPFVGDWLRVTSPQSCSPEEVAEGVRATFGIVLPIPVARTLLSRVVSTLRWAASIGST